MLDEDDYEPALRIMENKKSDYIITRNEHGQFLAPIAEVSEPEDNDEE